MCATKSDRQTVRQVRLFSDVYSGMARAFETVAIRAAIKCPGYDEPTAGSTVVEKRTIQDSATDAAWTLQTAKAALSAVEWAWMVCTHDAACESRLEVTDQPQTIAESRKASLAVLCDAYSWVHANPALVAALLEREFVYGEPWCSSLPVIASDVGASLRTVERVAARIYKAMVELGDAGERKLQAAFAQKGWMRVRRSNR